MAIIAELPIVYVNQGVPPRARTPGNYHVKDIALFSFPEAPSRELEPALTYRFHYSNPKNGQSGFDDIVFKQYQGNLVRASKASSALADNEKLTLELVKTLSKRGHHNLPENLMVPNISQYYYAPNALARDISTVKDKHVVTSGKAEAVAALQSYINTNMVFIDGVAYARTHDPRLMVYIKDGECITESVLQGKGPFAFPCDCPDLALEFTDWLKTTHGLEHGVNQYSWGGGEFIIENDSLPLSANPVIDAARWLTTYAELNVANHDYFGADVAKLGRDFLDEETVVSAMAFVDAFEEAAMSGKYETHFHFDKEVMFSAIRKFVDLMPEMYKPGYSDLISIDMARQSIRP